MNLQQVKQQLHDQYQIENFINLTEFDQLPRGKLYTALRKLHKDVFADNERVVFVACHPLKKTFVDQPHDIIITLQQYIKTFDIPHFFVIVVSNIESLDQELTYAHQMYNTQEVNPVQYITYD